MVRMNFIFILPIKMAIPHQFDQPGCSRKDKMKKHNWTPVLYWNESEGNKKIKLKKISLLFFSIFKKLGREGL